MERLVNAAVRRHVAAAEALALQRTDLLALEHMIDRDGVTPSELARALHLSSAGVTAVADRLVSARLVARRPGSGGRRRVLLRVTARGRGAATSGRAELLKDLHSIAGALPPEERVRLLRLLEALAHAVERQADLVTEAAAQGGGDDVPSPVLWG